MQSIEVDPWALRRYAAWEGIDTIRLLAEKADVSLDALYKGLQRRRLQPEMIRQLTMVVGDGWVKGDGDG